jgi:hypothetical protein
LRVAANERKTGTLHLDLMPSEVAAADREVFSMIGTRRVRIDPPRRAETEAVDRLCGVAKRRCGMGRSLWEEGNLVGAGCASTFWARAWGASDRTDSRMERAMIRAHGEKHFGIG